MPTSTRHRLLPWVLFAGLSAWGLFVAACVSTERAVVAPPQIAGAQYVGSKACAECHEDTVKRFGTASHARLVAQGAGLKDTACENCHGPGSLHVKAGGGAGTIVNPGKSPETCFQCHLDKRGQFSLPHSHPVLAGKMSCGDCHNPHEGDAVAGSGAALADQNAACVKCHTAQKGPFVFVHNAMKEGCTSCHNPHGSVNAKMLVARDANLCLRCHLEVGTGAGLIMAGGEDHRSRLVSGTCWTTGCHEAVHGSNASQALRY